MTRASATALTLAEAHRVLERCLQPAGPSLVGIETEWLIIGEDPAEPPAFRAMTSVLPSGQQLASKSLVTYEPGGQFELSGAPHATVGGACVALAQDLDHATALLAAVGLRREGHGIDPRRPPRRIVDTPRYAAMEAFFDLDGPDGRVMMGSTAALQVNVSLGTDEHEIAQRWELVHAMGPALVAAFANSPIALGRPTGWRSTRMATWRSIDRTRTAPPGPDEPARAWSDYALRARVMMIREHGGACHPVRAPLSMAGWITGGHELGYPTLDDLDYHLTTLFPPVRPRGWFEIRYLDALPDPWWRAAATLVTALLDDPAAQQRARAAVRGTELLWEKAARRGLEHPALLQAAAKLFGAARQAAPGVGADLESIAALDEYTDRYVTRGRCPADDAADEWARQQEMAAWT